ncbi:MAG: hypothetical protein H0X38_08170 [Planctomycetes bacterium]|nr:hypothetical protein [Planctomycetota bacterium]
MDWEGKIVAPRLACCSSGRVLAPGEWCHSALLLEEGGFVRRDFSVEAWDAEDQQRYLSWWRTRVPEAGNERKAFRLNAETLGQIFANLKDSRSRAQQCLAYVVALALVRARKLQFITVERGPNDAVLVLGDRVKDLRYRVRDPQMTPAEEQHVLDGLLAVTDTASGESGRADGSADTGRPEVPESGSASA